MKNIKFKNFSNYCLKNLDSEETKVLSEKFFLFNPKNLETSSKWIFAYTGELSAQNIIGFMELIRYPIVGNATMADKEPISFDCFDDGAFIYYEFENEMETLSRLDSFIVISNVEVVKDMRCQGVGASMYKYLEDLITEEDSLIEITRTIDGRNHNLLESITKVPVFTHIQDLYDIL